MTSTASTRASAATATHGRVRAWVVGCAVAEGVGMTAASSAALLADGMSDDARALALVVIVLGGLVEGTALGLVQARLLRTVLGPRVRAWTLTTVAVAGLGWAGASAPQALSGDSGGAPPPVGLVLVGAAGMGLAMGALLGAAQALALRGRVRHPWRWVSVSAAAWIPTMVVIFAGATAPSSAWHAYQTVPLGLLTGLVAGALLGLVCGSLLPTLDGPPPHALVLLGLLGTRAGRGPSRSLVGLRVTGVRSGRTVELPVQYAAQQSTDEDALIVVPVHQERKTWWRNLRVAAPLQVLYEGRWRPAYGRVVGPDDPEHAAALATYARRWPRVDLAPDQPVVVLRPVEGPHWSSTARG
jgi:hypothetical protein